MTYRCKGCGESSLLPTCLRCCERDEFLDHLQILLFYADPDMVVEDNVFTMEFKSDAAERVKEMFTMLANYDI